jgi:hypothetical protein
MSKQQSALPSYQELEWGEHPICDPTWPDRAWSDATAPLPDAGSQSAADQARLSAVTQRSALTLSGTTNLPLVRLANAAAAAAPLASTSINEQLVAEWFAHWRRMGEMGLVNLVPEPFRARFPYDSKDSATSEEDTIIKECLLHFLAWKKK